MSKKLNDKVRVCCIFNHKDAQDAILNFNCQVIKDLGDRVYNEDGSVKHKTHMWFKGSRSVVSCTSCGALFLYQCSEFDGYNVGKDYMEYEDYFFVNSLDEAIDLNMKYSALNLEINFKGFHVWNSEDGWHWNK